MRYLKESEVAKITGMSVVTLRVDRMHGKRLPYVKFGRSIRYDEDDVRTFMESNKVIPSLPERLAEARARLDELKGRAGRKPEAYILAKEVLALAAEMVPALSSMPNFEQLMSDLSEEGQANEMMGDKKEKTEGKP
jgi:predicted DNA-binding transcriptional regulator AlpA